MIPLLQTLPDIAGQTLTVDALLTQRTLARYLLEREAHYVFTAKGNHKLLLQDIALWFDTAAIKAGGVEVAPTVRRLARNVRAVLDVLKMTRNTHPRSAQRPVVR